MGGLEAVEYSTLAWLAVVVVGVSALVTAYAPHWNLLAVGDDWAASRGVSTVRLTTMGYIAGSVLTGLVTSLTGPIGFVGLIVPHALRLKLGADHRVLLPCAFLLGGAFLVVCDTLVAHGDRADGNSGGRPHGSVRRAIFPVAAEVETKKFMALVLVGGGARSGKSRWALERARGCGERLVYIATAEALDEEMAERIAQHRADRGDEFITVEEPLDLANAIRSAQGIRWWWIA